MSTSSKCRNLLQESGQRFANTVFLVRCTVPVLDALKYTSCFFDGVNSVRLAIFDLDDLAESTFTHDLQDGEIAFKNVLALLTESISWRGDSGLVPLRNLVQRELGQRMSRCQWGRLRRQVEWRSNT